MTITYALIQTVEKIAEKTDKAQIISSLTATLRFDGALNVDVTDPRTFLLSDEKKEARVLRWADCNDEEERENEEGAEEGKETGRWETMEESSPFLEEVESEPKTQEEEKPGQVESEQEAREEERRAQEARELKKAQEAREEERRAQEARELKRAQEAREEERRAHEAREDERRAQEALWRAGV